MPIYLYRCLKCDQYSEIQRPITTEDEPPECCGQLTRRIFSLGAVTFNGQGFYSTDNHAI